MLILLFLEETYQTSLQKLFELVDSDNFYYEQVKLMSKITDFSLRQNICKLLNATNDNKNKIFKKNDKITKFNYETKNSAINRINNKMQLVKILIRKNCSCLHGCINLIIENLQDLTNLSNRKTILDANLNLLSDLFTHVGNCNANSIKENIQNLEFPKNVYQETILINGIINQLFELQKGDYSDDEETILESTPKLLSMLNKEVESFVGSKHDSNYDKLAEKLKSIIIQLKLFQTDVNNTERLNLIKQTRKLITKLKSKVEEPDESKNNPIAKAKFEIQTICKCLNTIEQEIKELNGEEIQKIAEKLMKLLEKLDGINTILYPDIILEKEQAIKKLKLVESMLNK